VDEIVVVSGALLDATADGDFVCIGELEDVSGEAVDECEIGGGVVLAGASEVFIASRSNRFGATWFGISSDKGEIVAGYNSGRNRPTGWSKFGTFDTAEGIRLQIPHLSTSMQ
jgi:hypothetical protein